jgi:hypothetical protein
MKKILIVVMMGLGISVFGIDHGLISGFEVGWNIDKMNIMEHKNIEIDNLSLGSITFEEDSKDSIYIQLKTGYRLENLRIIGTYTSVFNQIKWDNYRPLQDRFRVDINYTFMNFKIGAFTWCDHSAISQNDQRDIFSNSGQRSIYISYKKEF